MREIFNPCQVERCNKNSHWSRSGRAGFCSAHYSKMRKYGNPLLGVTAGNGEPQAFYHDVALIFEGSECLVWPYGKRRGSGQMIKDGKRGEVTRFLCEDIYGPPPTDKHQAAHSCGKGHLGCVNKTHLRWATPKENQADRNIHGTHQLGESNKMSKLTDDEARLIFSLKGKESQRSIASRFGVSQPAVSYIHKGKRWIGNDI